MDELCKSITKQLRGYFDSLLVRNEGGSFTLYDDELHDFASCCTVGEVAALYLLDYLHHGGEGLQIAQDLAKDVYSRQLENGAFGQPYFVKKGEQSTVDIAEIGAVANSLYHNYLITKSDYAKETLLRSAAYLLTQISVENPGAVYKNPQATSHDVLNGDIYAAHAWSRAYDLTKKKIYLEKMNDVIDHVLNRFGKHSPGWWPYTENWDGSIGMGNSVSYQGTIIAFAHTCKSMLQMDQQEKWDNAEKMALDTMVKAMEEGPNDENEAPWWCRDWKNTWEIYLAFSRRKEETYQKKVFNRLHQINQDFIESGIEVFRPKTIQTDPERTPVTTTFRKAATFAGIFSYMILDNHVHLNTSV
ncbi:hypothetical protein ACLM5H_21625 [Fredinandcohnia humi]